MEDSRALTDIPDLRRRVRRLRWFRQLFASEAADLSQRFSLQFEVDDRRLAQAFFGWAKQFERERPGADLDRRDFTVFAGGLMLRELCALDPAKGHARPAKPPASDPQAKICEFWPEGFLYVTYCRNLVQAILRQDFNDDAPAPAEATDIRIWKSFRENIADDPASAIGFFDLIMGLTPHWAFPESFSAREDRGGFALPKAPATLAQ